MRDEDTFQDLLLEPVLPSMQAVHDFYLWSILLCLSYTVVWS